MVELRHLRYFLAVAEEKHFGRAAERLYMAQPPLSSQIKQLEAELGTVLLERTTRKVELTEAGALLLERTRQILADVEAAKTDVAEIGRGAAGVLRLGFSGTATYRLMPEIVRVARERLPLVRLQISGEMLTPRMEEALLENRLDAAILRPPVRSAELELDELRASRLVVALPQRHPLAAENGPVAVKELANENIVGVFGGSGAGTAGRFPSAHRPRGNRNLNTHCPRWCRAGNRVLTGVPIPAVELLDCDPPASRRHFSWDGHCMEGRQ